MDNKNRRFWLTVAIAIVVSCLVALAGAALINEAGNFEKYPVLEGRIESIELTPSYEHWSCDKRDRRNAYPVAKVRFDRAVEIKLGGERFIRAEFPVTPPAVINEHYTAYHFPLLDITYAMKLGNTRWRYKMDLAPGCPGNNPPFPYLSILAPAKH